MRTYIFISASVFLLSCSGSVQNKLAENTVTQEIAFSSDRNGNMDIYLMDQNGKHLKRITHHEAVDFGAAWAGNKNLLFFYSDRNGNDDIYSLNLKDSVLTNLTDDPAKDSQPSVSPDGKHILFMSDRNALSRCIYSMQADGGNLVQITNNDVYEEHPEWSPTGNQILFTRLISDSTGQNGEIHIMNADGTKPQRLTYKPGFDSGATFSPNGEKIAFYGLNNEQWDVFIMSPNGENLVNVTNDTIEAYSPDWSKDGEYLVYTAGYQGNYNLWKIHLESGVRTQLTFTNGRNVGPKWLK